MPSFKKLSALVIFFGLFACVANAAPAKPAAAKKEATTSQKSTSAAKCKVPAVGKQAPLKTRAVEHPSAKGSITLYHAAKAAMSGAVDLSKTRQLGDFNYGKGALYLTDSWWHAVQLICKSHLSSGDMVHVYEFKWNGVGTKVHEFVEDDTWKHYQAWIKSKGTKADTAAHGTEYKTILDTSDMISGPMKSPTDAILGIAPDFWQYALLNPAAVPKLVKQHEFQVKCKHILSGNPEHKTVRPTDEELNQLNNC